MKVVSLLAKTIKQVKVMEYIRDKKESDLVGILTKYIKKFQKDMKGKSEIADIEFSNWTNGKGDPSFCRIRIGDEHFEFKGNIRGDVFVYYVKKALEASKVLGIVNTFKTIGSTSRWNTEYIDVFDSLIVMAKPCKEFTELNKKIYRYAGKTLNDDEVFKVNVCGKRSSYSDSGNYKYLCHDEKVCQFIIDSIKKYRKSANDIISINLKDWFDKGDEGDYRCAQYHESEWYGSRGKSLSIDFKTKSGRLKYQLEAYGKY